MGLHNVSFLYPTLLTIANQAGDFFNSRIIFFLFKSFLLTEYIWDVVLLMVTEYKKNLSLKVTNLQ